MQHACHTIRGASKYACTAGRTVPAIFYNARSHARVPESSVNPSICRGLLLCLLLPMSGRAADAPIELEQSIDGVRVDVATGWIEGVVYARLENRSPAAALCEAEFRNGPESRLRRSRLEPGEARTLTFQPSRQVLRLRIDLRCRPDDRPVPDAS
jgi:hypothetical protein